MRDFNVQCGFGIDPECDHVGKHTEEEPNKLGSWMKQCFGDAELCGVGYNIQKLVENTHTFGSAINNWTMCFLTKMQKILHRHRGKRHDSFGRSDHRSVTAAFRFPCVQKKRGLDKKDRKQNLYKTYKIQQTICMSGPESSAKALQLCEDMVRLKGVSLAIMKQQQTRRQKLLSSSTTTTTAAQREQMICETMQEQHTTTKIEKIFR